MPIPPIAPPKGNVPAVERAIVVLEVLAAEPEPLTLAALTVRTGLPKSSVLGLCATLARGGLVERTDDGCYRLGVRIVDFAYAYLSHTDITTEFARAWESFGMPTETVVLSVLDGSDVIYVGARNGSAGLSFNYRIGMRLPAACTASGKALLSTLSEHALEALYVDGDIGNLTAHSLADMNALRADLFATRARGYALDDEETREGMTCIGVPVFDAPHGTAAVAAVAISMLKAEFATVKRERALTTLTRFADVLSRRLGGSIAGAPEHARRISAS